MEPTIKKIKQLNPKNILIVTGKQSYLKSSFKETIDKLKVSYSVKLFNYVKMYPDFYEINKFLEGNYMTFDLVISYGGGTVIDVSKLICIGYNFKSFEEVFEKKSTYKPIHHICIPTTFGSGSESTTFAVLYKDGEKFSINSKSLIPRDIILNPEYTLNLKGHLSYCSIMDSLCQAIESLWSKNNTVESSRYALKSIDLISKCINNLKSLKYNDRAKLLEASSLSGKAINITKTTAPHAFSYYLTYYHSICHGQAVSILFESFIELNFDYINDANRKALHKILNTNSKQDFILFFKKIKLIMGFDLNLKEIKNLDVDKYCRSINLERLKNNPVKITPKDLINAAIY